MRSKCYAPRARFALLVLLMVLVISQRVCWNVRGQSCVRWVPRTDVGTPGKRVSHAMTYDSDRGVTVFFGGEYSDAGSTTVSYYNDTWEYDGIRWKSIVVNGAKPDPRSGHAMVYDSAHKQVVLFGGVKQDAVYFGDMWVYTSNGTNGTWTQLYYANGPDPRAGHSMVYDSQRGIILLVHGNYCCDGFGYPNIAIGSYTWNGTTWTVLSDGDSAPFGTRGAAAYDSSRGVSVAFGGVDYASNTRDGTVTVLNDGTFEYDGAWHKVPGGTPSLRQQHAMAFDSTRGSVILFGGTGDDSTVGGKTDEYIGGVGWRSLFDSGPPPRARHAMVYDSKRKAVVLFGGASGDARYDDTWELVSTGPSFTLQPTNQVVEACASANFHVAVDGDPPQTFQWRKDGVPLVEGDRWRGTTSDTLTINRTQFADEGHYSATVTSPCGETTSIGALLLLSPPWTLIATNGPAPRYDHGMAYDEARGVTVLYGGQLRGNNPNGETWEWNGNTWFLRATNGPSPRYGVSIAYDSDRARTVLFGGNVGGNAYQSEYRGQTWEWDGSNWTLRATNGPAPRAYAPMIYDRAAKRCVLFGGYLVTNSNLSRPFDTWEYDGVSGTWVQVADGNPQPVGGVEALAYDSARNKRVLLTDDITVYGSSSQFLLVWEWGGTNWVRQSPQADPHLVSYLGGPSKVSGAAVAYHSRRGQVIINNGTDGNYARATWGYDGSGWELLFADVGPHAEAGGQMVYDTARDALVQFGGWDNVGYVGGETWELVDADVVQILKQPISASVKPGESIRFTVTVRGNAPLNYLWAKDGVNLADGGRISGARSGTLTITNADPVIDLGAYHVQVYNTCGGLSSALASVQFNSSGPVLELKLSSDRSQLSWLGTDAVLESATLITGPWTEIPRAASPFSLVIDQPTRFYRLRQL